MKTIHFKTFFGRVYAIICYIAGIIAVMCQQTNKLNYNDYTRNSRFYFIKRICISTAIHSLLTYHFQLE